MEPEQVADKKTKQPRDRSPNFPCINLKDAVEKTKDLYQINKKYLIQASVILEKWGYTGNSSRGRQLVAALKAFGLVETAGSGDDLEIKISESAHDALILNGPNAAATIKSMALKPAVHQQIMEKYKSDGSLPDDAALKYFLVKDVGFNNESVDNFIDKFKATLSFAKIFDGDSLDTKAHESSPKEEPKESGKEAPEVVVQNNQVKSASYDTSNVSEIPVFLDANKFVKIPYPLTEDDYSLLMDQLKLLKSRIVKAN